MKMSINDCARKAEDIGFESATFDLCGPNGKVKAKWLDSYMGLFQIQGTSGYNTVRQFENFDIWCENLEA